MNVYFTLNPFWLFGAKTTLTAECVIAPVAPRLLWTQIGFLSSTSWISSRLWMERFYLFLSNASDESAQRNVPVVLFWKIPGQETCSMHQALKFWKQMCFATSVFVSRRMQEVDTELNELLSVDESRVFVGKEGKTTEVYRDLMRLTGICCNHISLHSVCSFCGVTKYLICNKSETWILVNIAQSLVCVCVFLCLDRLWIRRSIHECYGLTEKNIKKL